MASDSHSIFADMSCRHVFCADDSANLSRIVFGTNFAIKTHVLRFFF